MVSDKKLLAILKAASVRAPGLLFPADPEFLAVYRDLIRVTSKPTPTLGQLNFYLSIPLCGDPSDTFDVFEIHSLPFSLPNASHFMQHIPSSPYVAFTENRRLYFHMSTLEHCSKHDSLLVCPPTSPVYEAAITETCESASFLDKPSIFKLCHTKLLKTFPPIFIKGPGYWTYSVPHPITLTLNCPTNPVYKHTIHIADRGVLTLRHGCSAHSPSFSLPAHDTLIGESPITVIPSPVKFPFPNITMNFSAILPIPDAPFIRSIDPTSLQHLQSQLQPILPQQQHPLHHPMTWWIIIGIAGAFFSMLVTFGVGYAIIHRYYKQQALRDSQLHYALQQRPPGRGLPKKGVCHSPENIDTPKC